MGLHSDQGSVTQAGFRWVALFQNVAWTQVCSMCVHAEAQLTGPAVLLMGPLLCQGTSRTHDASYSLGSEENHSHDRPATTGQTKAQDQGQQKGVREWHCLKGEGSE